MPRTTNIFCVIIYKLAKAIPLSTKETKLVKKIIKIAEIK